MIQEPSISMDGRASGSYVSAGLVRKILWVEVCIFSRSSIFLVVESDTIGTLELERFHAHQRRPKHQKKKQDTANILQFFFIVAGQIRVFFSRFRMSSTADTRQESSGNNRVTIVGSLPPSLFFLRGAKVLQSEQHSYPES